MARPNLWEGENCNFPTDQPGFTDPGGVCHVCCIVSEIRELNKPKGVRCRFMNANGCALHNKPEQPEACRQYNCKEITDLHAQRGDRGFAARIALAIVNGAFSQGKITKDVAAQKKEEAGKLLLK